MAEAEIAVFATKDVGRFFLGCRRCARVVPHYRCYGSQREPGVGTCRCGNNEFSPMRIPEWKAAIWVLVVGWFWNKTVRRRECWDPRTPMRIL